MTRIQHTKMATCLRSKITKAKNKAKGNLLLADKIVALQLVKKLESELYYHQLNYFELVNE